MSLQWAAAAGRKISTSTTVSLASVYAAAPHSLHDIGDHSPLGGLSLLLATVDVAALRASFLTFPLEKRHDGFQTLDVSSAHWHHPVDSRVPSFKCICSVHSWGGNGMISQPRWVLSNYNFLQIHTQLRGHIVNKRLTSGLVRQQHCGKWCVTSSGQKMAVILYVPLKNDLVR